MSNLLASGAAFLASQRKSAVANSVAYARGANSVTVLAGASEKPYEAEDGEGGIIQILSRDYLIAAAELLLAGAVVTPVPGDRITETIAGTACVYEVMAIGPAPCWTWHDSAKITRRIHSKEVA